MKLIIEVIPVHHNSIQVVDYTLEYDQYFPEDCEELLPRYYHFKYSDTCTIDVLKYVSTKGDQIINTVYTPHFRGSEALVLPTKVDGYYQLFHIVLPTTDWLEKVKHLDLSEYKSIYVTDGAKVYKYYKESLVEVPVEEVIQVNPFKTTISIVMRKVFTIDSLKHCYVSLCKDIFSTYHADCSYIEEPKKFNRDFIWMTINVITYLLEEGDYSQAQIVLEDLGCNTFCADTGNSNINNRNCRCSGN